jgi:hypothetical protein
MEEEPPSAESRESRLSHLLYAELLGWHDVTRGAEGSNRSSGDGQLNMPLQLAQMLAEHGSDQECILKEHCAQQAKQSRVVQAAQKALQAAQAEKDTLAQLLKQSLMKVTPTGSAPAQSIKPSMSLASPEVTDATDEEPAITGIQQQTPEPAKTDDNSSISADPVVVSEEMLQTSVIGPFEKAADCKIADKQADLQVQLQIQAKLSAVHATVREKCMQDAVGKVPSVLTVGSMYFPDCNVCSCHAARTCSCD